MRAITQIVVLSNPGTSDWTRRLLALDEDGYLWWTPLDQDGDAGPEPPWEAIRGPADNPPFMDLRDKLDRLEDQVRRQAAENEDLRKRVDELPPATVLEKAD